MGGHSEIQEYENIRIFVRESEIASRVDGIEREVLSWLVVVCSLVF